MAISIALLFGALILKLTDLVKYLRARDWNGVVTLLVSAAIGIVAVLLVANSAWADQIKVGDVSLGKLDIRSQIIFGVVASMFASAVYDFKKAIDGSDSARTPRLLPESATDTVPPQR